MFQIPVATSTAKAAQATWLKRRAASVTTPARRRTGTSAASTSWPPTQTVAARTCRKRRMVSQLTASIQLPSRPAVSAGRYYGPGNDRGVGAVGLGADRKINALRWLEYVMCRLL